VGTKYQQQVYRWIKQIQENPDDKETREKIVLHYTNLVRSLARRYAKSYSFYEDLVQVGMVGLLSAVNRFDEHFGKPFESFAVPTIIGEIKRYIRDHTWSVYVPRRVRELNPKINKAVEHLTNTYHRSPTINEIASYLEVTEEAILETLEMGRSYQAISMDYQFKDSENSSQSLLDIIGKQEKGFEEVQLKAFFKTILSTLSEREQQIIRQIYFENLTQREVGKQLSISQMHVSRLQRKALKRLRDVIRNDLTEIID